MQRKINKLWWFDLHMTNLSVRSCISFVSILVILACIAVAPLGAARTASSVHTPASRSISSIHGSPAFIAVIVDDLDMSLAA